MSLSYHIQHSSNLYNKAQFHQMIKMRGNNLILTINPKTGACFDTPPLSQTVKKIFSATLVQVHVCNWNL